MGRFGRFLALTAVSCALLAAYNVYADAPHVERMARQQACVPPQRECRARLATLRRTPFKQAFVFSGSGGGIKVDCTRAYLLVGSYRCTRQEGARAKTATPP